MLRSYKKLAALAVSASLLVSTAWAQNEPTATKENASGQAASSSEPQDPDAQVNPKTLAAIDLYAGDAEGAITCSNRSMTQSHPIRRASS